MSGRAEGVRKQPPCYLMYHSRRESVYTHVCMCTVFLCTRVCGEALWDRLGNWSLILWPTATHDRN